jgi:hypothetical protein
MRWSYSTKNIWIFEAEDQDCKFFERSGTIYSNSERSE